MKRYQGKEVSPGIAEGRILVLCSRVSASVGEKAGDVCADAECEWKRFLQARQRALSELSSLCSHSESCLGCEAADIFRAHRIILSDEAFADAVETAVRKEGLPAECAVRRAERIFLSMLSGCEEETFHARTADVKDVCARLVCILTGMTDDRLPAFREPVILCADDLSPSEAMQIDKKWVLAIVTRQGSLVSHTAILARMMGIPALTGVDFDGAIDGHTGAVDGDCLLVDPDGPYLENLRLKKKHADTERDMLKELLHLPAVTGDGRRIGLLANVGVLSDIEDALKNGAEGIGLFRSEFLFLGRESCPDEEEQFAVYSAAARMLGEKKLVIRTLDLGADKLASWMPADREENPAMGMRAIRLCLTKPELFRTQLRAILRAAVSGNVALMYPMITSLQEVRRLRAFTAEVKAELRAEGALFAEQLEEGIMIETPAAAVTADFLAPEADFFSIGTNDLTQYTLAADRQNKALSEFYDEKHEAVFRLMRYTVDAAHKAGIKVTVCGELAADTELTERLLALGVDELSVSPAFLLPVKKKVREL
ncbi:MAG: phosphoenolpyruvate--protein phosphotransferase [Eubacteriales bacterium]|nr:phosphoenolpyruvate--protein phosphotransferase [Eubacteriales bacterium]